LNRYRIGLIDYGLGNQASVKNCIISIGHKCLISDDPSVLEKTDLILLPGVGAFPRGIGEIHKRGLVDFLQNWARATKPIIGICLGMQLLTEASYEYEYTTGLCIIPGEIVPLELPKWHIGWNTIEISGENSSIKRCDGDSFYFNHSFKYKGPKEYKIGYADADSKITAIIRKDKTVGLQFHPEKSQFAGRKLLKTLINELVND